MLAVPPAILWLGGLAAQRLTVRGRPVTIASGIPAGVLAAGSAALMAAAAYEFRRARTTVDPMVPELASTLVTSGVLAASRNPMYLGFVGILVARALAHRSWKALVPAVAFAFAMDRWQIPAEEAALTDRFGRSYLGYRRDVPRWVGGRSRVGGIVPRQLGGGERECQPRPFR
ncbi:MAG: isoprenylcysteine carboxylmethyltransferase family protein [Bifidobacteriaceae bacterium]|jgi:protein-S-isoprenylcysteine O-methyltransferase Ste14|nr:isoprenylcysteine carboxylmethyltransferase family protein [Bifidobacteriaceae bacterium]